MDVNPFFSLRLNQFATVGFLPQCSAHFEFVQVVEERLAGAGIHEGENGSLFIRRNASEPECLNARHAGN